MKYIDADKLIAEIKRRKDIHRKNYEEFKDERFINDECEDDRVLSLITSLQQEQPELELTEEVKRYYSDNFAYISSDQPTLSILTNVARHFYELGLNARKGQPVEGLEKEIERFLASEESTTYVPSGKFTTSYKDPKKIASHFAEWGAEHLKK